MILIFSVFILNLDLPQAPLVAVKVDQQGRGGGARDVLAASISSRSRGIESCQIITT